MSWTNARTVAQGAARMEGPGDVLPSGQDTAQRRSALVVGLKLCCQGTLRVPIARPRAPISNHCERCADIARNDSADCVE